MSLLSKKSLINDIFQSANPLIYSNHCCKIALNAQCNINYTSVRNETQLRWERGRDLLQRLTLSIPSISFTCVNLTRTQHNKWNCFLEGKVPFSRFPHLFNPPSTSNSFSFNWRTMLSGENIFSQIELSQIMGDCNTTQQNTEYISLKIGEPSVNVGFI